MVLAALRMPMLGVSTSRALSALLGLRVGIEQKLLRKGVVSDKHQSFSPQ